MNKQEFEERINGKVSASMFDTIEIVYSWHPSIDETNGKDQIATIFKMFGMRIIYDMYPTAKEAERLYNEINKTKSILGDLEGQLEELKRGEK